MMIIINQFRPVDDPAGRLVPEEVQLSVIVLWTASTAVSGPHQCSTAIHSSLLPSQNAILSSGTLFSANFFSARCARGRKKCASQYEAFRGVIRRVELAKKVAKNE